jgi:hypothetical protein
MGKLGVYSLKMLALKTLYVLQHTVKLLLDFSVQRQA